MSHVDDCLSISDAEIITMTRRRIDQKYGICDFGMPNNYLSMQLKHTDEYLKLTSTTFIESLLPHFNINPRFVYKGTCV